MMKFKRFCAGLAALCMVCAVVPVLPVQETTVISAIAESEVIARGSAEIGDLWNIGQWGYQYKRIESPFDYTIYHENDEYYAAIQGWGADYVTCVLVLPASIWYDIDGDKKEEEIPIKNVSLTTKASEGKDTINWLILSDENSITNIQTSAKFIFYESDLPAEIVEEFKKEHTIEKNGYSKDESLIKAGETLKNYPHRCHIPEHLKSIDAETFTAKEYFAGNITIPASVTELSEKVFGQCGRLNNSLENYLDGNLNFNIEASIDRIPKAAFAGCKMSTVRFSPSITTIEENAFGTWGTTATLLGSEGAFLETTDENGKTEKSVIYHDLTFEETFGDVSHITSIGKGAFNGSPWLNREKDFNINETNTKTKNTLIDEKWQENPDNGVIYFGNGALTYRNRIPENTTIAFKEGTTFIADSAFEDCKNLAAVTLPDTLKSVGANAFNQADNLKEIYIYSKDCTIYDAPETLSGCNTQDKETDAYTENSKKKIHCYKGSEAAAYAQKYGYGIAYFDDEIILGDADGNNEIDILDVISINKAILGKENLSENGLKAIDFNGNSKPDSDEAMQILKFIVGLITSFES